MIRTGARIVLAIFYGVAGFLHLHNPDPFVSITPGMVPYPEEVVALTGVAEILGAIALIQPFSRRLMQAGAVGLAAYALCVWPANVKHMLLDFAQPDMGLGYAYHFPRMLAQPVIIWLAFWCGQVTDWPFRRMRTP